MTDQRAFTGDFVGIKHVRSRNALQFIIEVDETMADECLKRIGGLPRAGISRPVAIAVLEEPNAHADTSQG